MSEKINIQATASISFNDWTRAEEPPRVAFSSNTQHELSGHVVLIQGKFINGPSGDKQLMVSVDPAAIERKLAIRELNAQLEGRPIVSQTFAESL